ncbi:MAG: hypothetical protein ABSF18_06475 [Gammaproteobacteria bacterium]
MKRKFKPHSGHIYVVDIKAFDATYGWLLTAILLHKKPLVCDAFKYPQATSAARFKIKSPELHKEVLSIQQALIEGRRVHAEVLFNDFKLCGHASQHDIPSSEAELLAFDHVVVTYRNNS